MKKPWRTTAVILVVVEAISSCSITQATTSPLASDIAAVVDDGSHHSKDRAEEELKESSRIESFGKDLQHQQQLQLENVAGPKENNKLMGVFLQEAEMDEGDAYYPASIRKTAPITTTTTNVPFSGHEVLEESHYHYYRPSSSSNRATRRTENNRELQRYHDGYDDGTNYHEETTSSTETPTATPSSAPTTTPSSAPTTTTALASSAPTLSTTTKAHRSNNGYSSFFFPKAHPSPSTIIADSRDSIEFLTRAPTTTMTIRGAAATEATTSQQTTAVGDGMTETDSSFFASPAFPTAPPSTEELLEVDGAPRLLLATWARDGGLSSTAAATVVVVAAVVLAGFPFTEMIV